MCTSEVFTNMPSVHTDSGHWEFRNGYWICADESYHQALYDRWIETNDKWYYVDNNGHMLSNTLIYNICNHSWYHVDENGVWIFLNFKNRHCQNDNVCLRTIFHF